MRTSFCLALLLATSPPALAQDANSQDYSSNEVVVSANRRQFGNYEQIPLVGLRRTADFAVQYASIAGDTRDTPKRREEIFAMVRSAILLAGQHGVDLATGQVIVEPLTLENYRNLPLMNDGRPDSDRVSFIVKTRLAEAGDAKAALERIEAFIKSVPPVGRAEMRMDGGLTLSVVGPNKYRGQIIDLISADAKATGARLGPDYAVEARGLDRPVEWSRATLTEVFLYVPYNYTVVPTRR
jgi:hypothetical protein